MKYIRDLQTTFNTEADKRGIDVEQLPSGEMHIYRQKIAKQLDEHLNIITKVYFDQMEKRGFTKKSQQKHLHVFEKAKKTELNARKTELDKILDNAKKNQDIFNSMLGGIFK